MRFEIFPVQAAFQVEEGGSFVLEEEQEKRYSELWQQRCKEQPELVDGELLYLDSFDEKAVRGVYAPYRYWYAQRESSEPVEEPLVSVAVTGLLRQHDQVLLGKRSNTVTQDRGLWEVVPSGGLSRRGSAGPNYIEQLRAEFCEEVCSDADVIEAITPYCLILDHAQHVLDIVATLDVSWELQALTPANVEYVAFRVVSLSATASVFDDDAISPISRELLASLRKMPLR